MLLEPADKRALAFVDGQNLYRAAKEAFGCSHPNYDIQRLATAVCSARGWKLLRVQFYTGVPDHADDPRWHAFWTNKLAMMRRQGIQVFSRSLRYRDQMVHLPDGKE